MKIDEAWLKKEVDRSIHNAVLWLLFHDYFFAAVLDANDVAQKSSRQREALKYELGNIFCRLYMSSQNYGVKEFCLDTVWKKMLGELTEKKFPVLPEGWKEYTHESTDKLFTTLASDYVKKHFFEFKAGSAETSRNIRKVFDEEVHFLEKESVCEFSFLSKAKRGPKMSLGTGKEKYDSLMERAQQFVEKFDNVVTAFEVVKVAALNYMPASGSLYWGFGPKVYKEAQVQMEAKIEAYASPFNHSLNFFCSPFDIDVAFGSLGSFYKVDWQETLTKKQPNVKCIVANPPYIEKDLEMCCSTIGKILKVNPSITLLSICPDWTDAPGIKMLTNLSTYKKILGKDEHCYFNYQRLTWISAKFPSIAFGFGPIDGKLEKIDTIFGAMKMEDDGSSPVIKKRKSSWLENEEKRKAMKTE